MSESAYRGGSWTEGPDGRWLYQTDAITIQAVRYSDAGWCVACRELDMFRALGMHGPEDAEDAKAEALRFVAARLERDLKVGAARLRSLKGTRGFAPR